MRVIICGAGQVGANIAAYLSREDNDVTVIDIDPSLINEINNELEVRGIVGHASIPDTLNTAGALDADMIIAVTQSDEVNMVACQIAHSLFNVPRKIARIRNQAYLQPAWSNLFSRSHMPIDVIISPEVAVANSIYERLALPGTTYVVRMADNLLHLIGVMCSDSCPVLNTSLGQIYDLFPNLSFKVVSILRRGQSFIPSLDDSIQVDDEVFIVMNSEHLKRVMCVFGKEESEAYKIVIAGGGNIGMGLVSLLQERGKGINLKIIERNPKRARLLSEKFEDVLVLQGDALDQDILDEASIQGADAFVAVTNDDEGNILGSLLAKQNGCRRVVTLVNNPVYSTLIGSLGVDVIVSPRSTVVATIMRHVRRGRIKGIYTLRNGLAEVIEAEVSENAMIVNKSMRDLGLPKGVILAALIRKGEVHIPDDNTLVRQGDRVVIISSQEAAAEVERIFSAHVELF